MEAGESRETPAHKIRSPQSFVFPRRTFEIRKWRKVMKLPGEAINDAFEMVGYISTIIILVWGICLKLIMRERERSEERIRQNLLRQKQEEQKKLPKPARALPPPQQKQLSARGKVALIVEKNNGE
jgi:hypothetical protein